VPKSVIVYHQPGCGPCHEAMEYLTRKGIEYVAKDVREDRAALKELLDLGYASTPVIVIDGQGIVGFDVAAIDKAVAEGE
jgi:glutaredoxin